VRRPNGIIFDLDQTLVDTSFVQHYRDSGQWKMVYENLHETKPYNQIDDLLIYLRKTDFKIGIVTSAVSKYCHKIINLNNWNFDAIIAYHDTRQHKPHHEPITKCLSKLELNGKNVISIGDKADDIFSAKSAGTITIGALWGSAEHEKLTQSNPNLIAQSPKDIIYYIEKL
tara:strand:+ start:277 stop:789 length:513 start_codon:yes stop_codon:yes gene_type:complete